jgi:hypothetical protein
MVVVFRGQGLQGARVQRTRTAAGALLSQLVMVSRLYAACTAVLPTVSHAAAQLRT